MTTVTTAFAARAARAMRWNDLKPWVARGLLAYAAFYVARYLGAVASRPAHVRPFVAAALVLPVVIVGLTRPRQVMVVLLAFLPFLGMFRRLASTTSAPERDPLLLVAPLVVGILIVAGIRSGAFARLGLLSNAVLAMCYIILLGAFNPIQGKVTIGISGLLFTLVPVLWFWVARAYVDDRMFTRIVVMLAVIGVVVGGYGLIQTYAGFPSWDTKWIDNFGYSSLSVGGTIRPFASFVSAAEYGTFLAICIVLWVILIPRFQSIAVVLATVLFWALILESIRGAVFILFLMLGVLAAIRLKLGVFGAIAMGACGLVLVTFVATMVRPTQRYDTGSKTGNLLRHQIDGLANPFDNESSTADQHASLIFVGLHYLPIHPLGVGSGATTIASSTFGGDSGTGAQTVTEADVSNVAVAWGYPGMAAFLLLTSVAMTRAIRLAGREGGLLPFAALALMLGTLLGWFTGGNYAVAPLPWLAMGWLDRRYCHLDDDPA